jgi:hypothetical protein
LKHYLWDKNLEFKWTLMNVYGAAQDENKERFLADLASMCANNKEALLMRGVGDFNILRFSSRKSKIFHPNRFSNLFNVVIQMFELKDIYISGVHFTWTNN